MPRAYLRMSPDLDQHPDPLSMLKAMCAAARQPERGRFRAPVVLERAVGKRQYREMVQRGDVIAADPGPGVYLAGWDEWQEGDHTVAERMHRMRLRRKGKTVSPVTPPPSPDRIDVTTDAGTSSVERLSGDGDGVLPPNPPPSGGRRSEGTNPRAKAKAASDLAGIAENSKRWRRNQRQLAYHRGALTEAQLAEQNRDDAPLERIPGYAEAEAIA